MEKRVLNVLIRFTKGCIDIVGVMALCMYFSYFTVQQASKNAVVRDLSKIKPYSICMVFGTSPFLHNNRVNDYYRFRIQALKRLNEKKKIGVLILSGDKSGANYDEPSALFQSCLAIDIPAHKMKKDSKGFSTIESLNNLKKYNSKSKIVLVSQEFQLRRAIYLAQKMQIDVIGYPAKNSAQFGSFKARIRELPACFKACIEAQGL